jgi:hypothetical protein
MSPGTQLRADLGGGLLVQVGRIVAVDLDTDHGASNSSPIMRSVLLRPRVAGIEDDGEPVVDAEVLIEEARQRQRRRRRSIAAAVTFALVAGALAFGTVRLSSDGNRWGLPLMGRLRPVEFLRYRSSERVRGAGARRGGFSVLSSSTIRSA